MSVIDASFTVVSHRRAADFMIKIDGEIGSASAAGFRGALRDALGTRPARLIVDLTSALLVDKTGLGVLVGADARAKATGTQLVLRGLSPSVAHLLVVTGLDRVLTVTP